MITAENKLVLTDFIEYCKNKENFNKRDTSILIDAYFEYINK